MFDMLAEVTALFVHTRDLEVHLDAIQKEFLVRVLQLQCVLSKKAAEDRAGPADRAAVGGAQRAQ
jgi:hypothetical protein